MVRRAGWLFWAVISYGSAGLAQSAAKPDGSTHTFDAQPEAASAAAEAKQPLGAPDVVVLKDGSRFRGTIAELVKGGPITIVLVTGETRRLEAEAIAFAGPASAEPSQAPAPPPVSPPSAERSATSKLPRVRFSSNAQYTEFFYETPAGYLKLCAAPCVLEVPPRVYNIGARISRGDDVVPLRRVLLDQPTELTADVRDRSGTRGAGGLVLGLSLLELVITGLVISKSEHTSDAVGVSALSTGVVGSLVGLGLVLVDDSVGLSVRQAP